MPRRQVAPRAPPSRSAADSARCSGRAAVTRLLGGVDHQLLPHRQAVLIGRRAVRRRREQLAVALAHPHALEREQRPRAAALRARAGHGAICSPAPTAMTIIGTSALRAKNRARCRAAVGGAVDAEQHGRAGDAAAVQQVADRDVRRARRRSAPGGRRRSSAWSPRAAPRAARRGPISPVSIRARSSVISPWRLIADDVVEQRLDPRAACRPRPTRAAGPRTASAAGRCAGGAWRPKPSTPRSSTLACDSVAAVEVEQRVGDEPVRRCGRARRSRW